MSFIRPSWDACFVSCQADAQIAQPINIKEHRTNQLRTAFARTKTGKVVSRYISVSSYVEKGQ